MPSRFASATARLDAGVDGLFGEPVRLRPRRTLRVSGAGPDPDRPERDVVAVIRIDPADAGLFAGRREGRAAVGSARVTVPGAVLQLSPAFAAGLGYRLADGDIVERLDAGDARRIWRIAGPPHVDERGLVTADIVAGDDVGPSTGG